MENTEDYLARLNLEGERKTWLKNQPKIEHVFTQSKKYIKPGMSACEIGLGNGHLLRLLYNYGLKTTGIDISKYIVDILGTTFTHEGIAINLLIYDLSKPFILSKKFDAVFCLDVIEHVSDLENAIKNIKQILRPGGILVATLPWKENIDVNMVVCPECHHKFHRIGHHHSFHSIQDITNILGQFFQIITFRFVPPKGLENVGISVLQKTIFRKKYYKGGLPNFPNTCFFIARLNNKK